MNIKKLRCCVKGDGSPKSLIELRQLVYTEIANPVCRLFSSGRLFMLPTKECSKLVIALELLPPDISLRYETTLGDFEFRYNFMIDTNGNRYFDLDDLTQIVNTANDVADRIGEAMLIPCERGGLPDVLRVVNESCDGIEGLTSYIDAVSKLLNTIQEKCRDSGDWEYRAIADAFLEYGEDYVSSIDEDELRSLVEDYDD